MCNTPLRIRSSCIQWDRVSGSMLPTRKKHRPPPQSPPPQTLHALRELLFKHGKGTNQPPRVITNIKLHRERWKREQKQQKFGNNTNRASTPTGKSSNMPCSSRQLREALLFGREGRGEGTWAGRASCSSGSHLPELPEDSGAERSRAARTVTAPWGRAAPFPRFFVPGRALVEGKEGARQGKRNQPSPAPRASPAGSATQARPVLAGETRSCDRQAEGSKADKMSHRHPRAAKRPTRIRSPPS